MRELKDGVMSVSQLADIKDQLETTKFKSKLKCFSDHFGLRSAELSTIIAPYGSGKSSFVRTIDAEMVMQGKKVYQFLSEEQIKFYNYPLYYAMYKLAGEEKANEVMKNIKYECQYEMNDNEKNIDRYIKHLEEVIVTYGIEVVIFDNFSTSFMGRAYIDKQAEAVEKMKEIAVKYNVVFMLVVHTGKGADIYNKVITGEDVRGNATTANIGSYNYVLSTYFRLDTPRTFLTVDKARYHSGSNKKVYELFYDTGTGLFTKDKESNYETMQAIMTYVGKQKKGVKIDL